MGKVFNRIVEKAFAEMLALRVPGFVRTPADRLYGWPCGERAFARTVRGRTDWLSLCFSKDGCDEFTIDVGWSYLGRYPQISIRPMIETIAELVRVRAGEAFVRVRPLSGERRDWWKADEIPAGETPVYLVRDAIDGIERFALPILQSLPEEKG